MSEVESANGSQSLRTPESIVERVTRDAYRAYGDTIDEETLAGWATVAVRDLWGESVKVTMFVPLLAMREIDAQIALSRPAPEA